MKHPNGKLTPREGVTVTDEKLAEYQSALDAVEMDDGDRNDVQTSSGNLMVAFIWGNAPQGYKFWKTAHKLVRIDLATLPHRCICGKACGGQQ